MPDTTLTIGRANGALEAPDGRDGEKPGSSPATPPGTPATGVRWIAGLLSVVGTSALVFLLFLLSPGLRSDLGGLVALIGNIGAAGIRDWVLSFGALSPVIYFSVVVGQVIVSPIPAGPVTLAGALVFGVWEGLALSLAGSVVGSVLVFGAARRWGGKLVVGLVGEKTFRKYTGMLDAGGWWLFAILLLPFVPDDAAVALAGLSALKFRRFLAIMVVGRIPGSTLTALLASEWVTGSAAAWISVGTIVAVVLALGFVYRERLETRMFRRAGTATVGLDAASKEKSAR